MPDPMTEAVAEPQPPPELRSSVMDDLAWDHDRTSGVEEELLFPEFERLTGMSPLAGPTAVMRHEHRLLGDAERRALVDRLRA